jgi:hypothetical protein
MIDKKSYILSLGIALSTYPLTGEKPVFRFNPDTETIQAIPPGDDSLLVHSFKKQAVFNDDFVRDTFYTWTSPEQIAELRSGQNLLSRSKSKDNKLSHFDLAIRDPAFSKSPITALLQDTLFTNKRFAWTNAWATVMGWDNEKCLTRTTKSIPIVFTT